MKLILKQEVAGLGGPGDIIEVKDGYGRNYLVPQGLATVANRGAEKEAALIRKGRDVREIRDRSSADEVANQLKALSVTLTARAGAEGRLFGSITTADVADAVKAAGGPEPGQASDRADQPDQDGRLAPGLGPAAPRAGHHPRRRGCRQLVRSAYEPGQVLRGPAGLAAFRGQVQWPRPKGTTDAALPDLRQPRPVRGASWPRRRPKGSTDAAAVSVFGALPDLRQPAVGAWRHPGRADAQKASQTPPP